MRPLLIAAQALAADVTLDVSGRLLDSTGAPVADGAHPLAVRVFAQASEGSPVWSGTVNVETASGVFQAVIGGGTPPLDVSHLDGERWVEFELPENGGTMLPRNRLSAVPLAARSIVTAALRYTAVEPECTASHLGDTYIDPSTMSLRVCGNVGSGARWYTLASGTVVPVLESGTRTWSDGSYAASCDDYRHPPAGSVFQYTGTAATSGVYRINPGSGAYDVWCEMDLDGGGWTYVAEPGRSTTDPTDTFLSGAGSYHRYIYDLRGHTYDEALVVRPSGRYWCNSWGSSSTAWTQPGTTSMGIAFDTNEFHYANGGFTPYRWIVQPYSISSSCNNCWASNNSTLSPVGHRNLDGATGGQVVLDPPGASASALEVSNLDAFTGMAGGCNLAGAQQATWSAYVR